MVAPLAKQIFCVMMISAKINLFILALISGGVILFVIMQSQLQNEPQGWNPYSLKYDLL